MFEVVDVSRMTPAQALGVMEQAARVRRLAEAQEALALLRLVRTYRHDIPADKVQLGGDGTPPVDDFACLEAAAALGQSVNSVSARAADLLDLEHRHPSLWGQLIAGRVPMWLARQIARTAHHLTAVKALWVDATIAPFTTRLGPARLLRFVEGLVVQADPEAADARAEAARSGKRVSIGPSRDGVKDLYGVIDAADGIWLDAALTQLSDILAAAGDTNPAEVRRATAIGILATPARALAMIQAAAQPALTDGTGATCEATLASQTGEDDHDDADNVGPAGRGPAGCAGHVCGTITTDPAKLLPKATLVVHISDRTLATGQGVCRAEGVGPVTLTDLKHLLGTTQITVRPVFDPETATPVDCYEIPAAIRRATLLHNPFDIFPYGTRPAAGLDLDHTIPYRPDGPPGQTRVANLGPLTRKAHRAKTIAGWQLTQPVPDRYCWSSPLGRHYVVTQAGLTLNRQSFGEEDIGGPLLPDLPQPRRRPLTRPNGTRQTTKRTRRPRPTSRQNSTPRPTPRR